MAWILLFFAAGILLGSLMGHKDRLMRSIGKLSEGLVLLLLFLLGAVIGSNEQVMGHLWGLGVNALALAAGSILGSLILAKPVERLLPGDIHEG
jgi:peptidoglycan/LPS O-acetylase OafA/YrhL